MEKRFTQINDFSEMAQFSRIVPAGPNITTFKSDFFNLLNKTSKWNEVLFEILTIASESIQKSGGKNWILFFL